MVEVMPRQQVNHRVHRIDASKGIVHRTVPIHEFKGGEKRQVPGAQGAKGFYCEGRLEPLVPLCPRILIKRLRLVVLLRYRLPKAKTQTKLHIG